MSDHDSLDSDHQGFFPNKIEIKSCTRQQQDKAKSAECIFEPNYLLGTPMLRKEPKECYNLYRQISVKSQNSIKAQIHNEIVLQKLTAYQTYMLSSQYENIYSRFKLPFGNDPKNPFQNEIKFKTSFNSGNSHFFRSLKDYNFISQQIKFQDKLILDSKFQSGNLLCAFRSKKQCNTYVLMMQNDTNTYGYNQWFYFSIRNATPNRLYTFKIVNFKKKYSFFKMGMKPVIFSLKEAQKTGNGWYRDGKNVKYYQSNFRQKDNPLYYTLQFQISFEHKNDYITISPYPPYSYSRLTHSIQQYTNLANSNNLTFQLKSVACSLGGNNVPYFILSQPNPSSKKPAVVILGRQHSGQVWSSFLIQQLMRELIDKRSVSAQWFLQTYDLHVFPMINVDGVINGNFRCDIAGYDLNRCWKDPSPNIHPQLYAIKQILQTLSSQNTIDICLDLHTHSKDFGVFAYCCSQFQPFRTLPYQISRLTQLFRYRSCTFGITQDKRQTARAALFEMTKSANIITIQMSSFGVRNYQTKLVEHFSIEHMECVARALIQSIYLNKSGQAPIFSKEQLRSASTGNFQQQQDHPVSGSDSQPEADEIQVGIRLKKLFAKTVSSQFYFTKKRLNKKMTKRMRRPQKWETKTQPYAHKQTSKINASVSLKSRYDTKKQDVKNTNIKQKQFINKSPSQIASPSLKNNKPFHFSNQFPISHRKKIDFLDKRNIDTQQQYKPLNMMEFSLKKLPIFASQAIPQSYNQIVHQNQSLMLATMTLTNKFKQAKGRFDKTHSAFKKSDKKTNVCLEDDNKQMKTKEGFPFLCIMSENKRHAHFQKIKDRRQRRALNRTQIQPISIEEKQLIDPLSKQIEQKKQYILTKLSRERIFLNVDMFSKKWAQNCAKYKMSANKF